MACSLDISHTYFTLSPRHAVEQQVQGYDASVLRTPAKSRRSYGPTEGIVHQVSLVCLPTCLFLPTCLPFSLLTCPRIWLLLAYLLIRLLLRLPFVISFVSNRHHGHCLP